MPHSKHGDEIKLGDRVLIFARVTSVQPGADYCNCTVVTEEPMHPGDTPTAITLNTKQLEHAAAIAE